MFVSALFVLLSGPAWAGDKDKDGIKKGDQCPEEPEDKDGFEDEDGCPDLDNDQDGIPDTDDKCANEPEDKDGFEDTDGCPDPDNDGDGVLDAEDKCPNEIENDDVKDGCPAVTYDLMSGDGWAPAIQQLNDELAAALGKGAEGCTDASKAGKMWFEKHDPSKLHSVFKARVDRAPADVNTSITMSVLNAQALFWESAKGAFEIYCKDDSTWMGLAPRFDDVYAKAAEKAPGAVEAPKPAPKKKK